MVSTASKKPTAPKPPKKAQSLIAGSPPPDFGKTVASITSAIGEPAALYSINRGIVQQWQEQLRKLSVKTPADVEAARASWKPEAKRRGKPPIDKALKAVSGLTADERAELLKRLQAD